MNDRDDSRTPTLFGHPTGLFTLFFAEMWERFSYYGMRALLVFYLMKGFMGLNDSQAYAVYGSYTALVYMTPFFGGMLADRLIGQRRAVLLGGILMAAGHFVLTFEYRWAVFNALGLLIIGNGFFKPNISTMVGGLYPKGSQKRDGGFIIFYMGINLGAALAPLLCGYVGEKISWHLGFGLATIGMLVGLAVFWAPTALSQALILATSVLTAVGMIWTQWGTHPVPFALYAAMGATLLASAYVAFRALGRGGLPSASGAPPDSSALDRRFAGIRAEALVYLGSILAVPVIAWLVGGALRDPWIPGLGKTGTPAGLILALSGIGALIYIVSRMPALQIEERHKLYVALILIFFSMLFWAFFEQAGSSMNNFTDRNVDRVLEEEVVDDSMVGTTIDVVLTQEQLGFGFPGIESVYDALAARIAPVLDGEGVIERDGGLLLSLDIVPAELLPAGGGSITAVDSFSYLWAAKTVRDDSEQGGRADLNRAHTIEVSLPKKDGKGAGFWSMDSLARAKAILGSPLYTLDKLNAAWDRLKDRAAADQSVKLNLDDARLALTVEPRHRGMGLARSRQEIPASTFQAVNPTFIILFGLVFTALWAWLAARRTEPSTPLKFAFGLAQLGLGFLALYWGAQNADARGMVAVGWLVLGYLLHTTGELCLSPVGLSMITRLSPLHLVSTMMGMWFLASAFSNFLAAWIAQLTGVGEESGGAFGLPVPAETVSVYGDVFLGIGIIAICCAAVCFLLVPLLKKWMHEEANPSAMH